MPGIDIYRGTQGVPLPPQVSQTIWSTAQEQSAAMRAAQQIPLPGAGIQIPIITGDPEAQWVAETELKPVSRPTFASKTITGYTLAVIVPFSNQFRRDVTALYNACTQRLPLALAKKFDQTVFGPTGGRPGSDFDTLGGATSVGIAGKAYAGLIAAQSAVTTFGAEDGDLTGWILSAAGRSALMGALDTTGRPLLDLAQGELLGAPYFRSRAAFAADADGAGSGTAKQVGFAGDWTMAFWGSVEGVSVSISDQATIEDTDGTQINLWQRNMFAVRAEIEVGFRVRDLGYFVKLTDAVQA